MFEKERNCRFGLAPRHFERRLRLTVSDRN